MRQPSARLLLGATLLLAGVGMLSGSPVRNAVVQTVASAFDMKERQCEKVPAAAGSQCPAGCVARPLRSPEDRGMPTECHSALWVATCGKACAPAPGYARLPDGSLVDATRLSVTLSGPPSDALNASLKGMQVALSPRFDGMYRYDASVSGDFEKTRTRLAALPGVVSVEPIAK